MLIFDPRLATVLISASMTIPAMVKRPEPAPCSIRKIINFQALVARPRPIEPAASTKGPAIRVDRLPNISEILPAGISMIVRAAANMAITTPIIVILRPNSRAKSGNIGPISPAPIIINILFRLRMMSVSLLRR